MGISACKFRALGRISIHKLIGLGCQKYQRTVAIFKFEGVRSGPVQRVNVIIHKRYYVAVNGIFAYSYSLVELFIERFSAISNACRILSAASAAHIDVASSCQRHDGFDMPRSREHINRRDLTDFIARVGKPRAIACQRIGITRHVHYFGNSERV